jgi:pimeloyl-ACP methyl ester carboxylesterase
MKRLLAILSGLLLAVVLSFAQAAPAAASSHTPVIFIHGFAGKGEQWSTMRSQLVASGYPQDRLHVFTYDWLRSNKTIAGQLSSYVDGVLAQHGASKVHLVSHSMGGLSSRWYVKHLGGAQKVDHWISIGGPNNGTNIAGLCPGLVVAPELREARREDALRRQPMRRLVAQGHDRLFVLTRGVLGGAQIPMVHSWGIGVEAHGMARALKSPGSLPVQHHKVCHEGPSVRVIWVQLERCLDLGDTVGKQPIVCKHQPVAPAGVGVPGVERDGLLRRIVCLGT